MCLITTDSETLYDSNLLQCYLSKIIPITVKLFNVYRLLYVNMNFNFKINMYIRGFAEYAISYILIYTISLTAKCIIYKTKSNIFKTAYQNFVHFYQIIIRMPLQPVV